MVHVEPSVERWTVKPEIGWPAPPFEGAVHVSVTAPLLGVARKPVRAPKIAWLTATTEFEATEV